VHPPLFSPRPSHHPHPQNAAGISFQRLFQRCRERFLVSNEMLLRAFLTEFRDHDLLGTK
jgi:origin recognition complex subunit 2